MQTPDFTPVQIMAAAILGLFNSILGGLALFGVNLTIEQVAYLNAVLASFAGVVIAADAVIRQGRAKNVNEIIDAKLRTNVK